MRAKKVRFPLCIRPNTNFRVSLFPFRAAIRRPTFPTGEGIAPAALNSLNNNLAHYARGSRFVKHYFRPATHPIGQIHHSRKSADMVEPCHQMLCRPELDIIHEWLWKSPVDNSVEIVEKFRFSTFLTQNT